MNITVDKQYTEKAFISQVKADIKSFKSVFTEHDLLWTLSEKTGKTFYGTNILMFEDLRFVYEYVGVRFQEPAFKLGEIEHTSHVWFDCEDTGIELDGLCAIHIDHIDAFSECVGYYGEHCAIICGNRATWGEDEGEIIIEDPVCEIILA